MTSLLCVKSLDGKVQVHDKDVAGTLTADEGDNFRKEFIKKLQKVKKPQKRPRSTPVFPYRHHTATVDANSLLASSAKHDWISKKQVKDVQEKSLLDHANTQRLYMPILEEERTFVKQDVGNFLNHIDMLDLRKKELLHKTWSDRVYEPIRRKILEAMNSDERSENYHRRQELYHQFLEHVNKRGHVFLDTMDKGEYYAQALNSHRPAPLTVCTQALQDPLLQQSRERNKEDQTVLRCITGIMYSHADIEQLRLPPLPLNPMGRHGTDNTTWLEMPLLNIDSTPRKASRLRMNPQRTKTQIDFGEWSSQPVDGRVVDKELQLRHKRMFEEKPPYGIPARQFAKAPFANQTTSAEHGASFVPVDT